MRRCIVFLLAVVLCVACGQPATIRQSQTVDGLTITLEHARELPINRDQEMTVTLADSSGTPVDGAIVALDLVMPAMPMGQNKPLADPLGGGRYRVRAAYSMLGDWKTTVRAMINGKAYEATFDQLVVE